MEDVYTFGMTLTLCQCLTKRIQINALVKLLTNSKILEILQQSWVLMARRWNFHQNGEGEVSQTQLGSWAIAVKVEIQVHTFCI